MLSLEECAVLTGELRQLVLIISEVMDYVRGLQIQMLIVQLRYVLMLQLLQQVMPNVEYTRLVVFGMVLNVLQHCYYVPNMVGLLILVPNTSGAMENAKE